MQNELLKKIDFLLDMAGTNTNHEIIEEDILMRLKTTMNDTKYLKENDRIIDENIKVGLESKRQVYEYELDTTNKKLSKASHEEEDNHQSLANTIKRLSSLKNLLDTLELKVGTVYNNKNLTNFYDTMIEKTRQSLDETEKKKAYLDERSSEIHEQLEQLSNKKLNLQNKINHINKRLEDTLEALSTPNFYVDKILKQKDEEKIDKLNYELETLENERLKLFKDPSYIAHQAKSLLEIDDRTSAFAEIKKLIEVIKEQPYINDSKEHLEELLERATIKRDEFANLVNNKNYFGEDIKIIDKRIDYLNSSIADLKDEEKSLLAKITKIDQERVVSIFDALAEAEKVYDSLKSEYDEYNEIIYNLDDSNSPRKKASLQAAFHHKKEEMDAVYELTVKYQKELEDWIALSKNIESTDLLNVREQINNLEKEINSLKKSNIGKSKAKDILAMEKDKNILKELSDEVDIIKFRLSHYASIDKIFEEVSVLLRSEDSSMINEEGENDNADEELLQALDYIDLDDFRLENLEDSSVDSLPQEATEEPEVLIANLENSEVLDEKNDEPKIFPPRSQVTEDEVKTIESPRYKVVNVQPLELDEKNQNFSQSEPTQDDSLNDEYIDFSELLNGGN